MDGVLAMINDTARIEARRQRVVQLQQLIRSIDRDARMSADPSLGLMELQDTDWRGRAVLSSLVAPHRVTTKESVLEEVSMVPHGTLY